MSRLSEDCREEEEVGGGFVGGGNGPLWTAAGGRCGRVQRVSISRVYDSARESSLSVHGHTLKLSGCTTLERSAAICVAVRRFARRQTSHTR